MKRYKPTDLEIAKRFKRGERMAFIGESLDNLDLFVNLNGIRWDEWEVENVIRRVMRRLEKGGK